jgi:hypothetical protein
MRQVDILNQLSIEELESYCFNNFDKEGLFLINYLMERYNNECSEGIYDIISQLLDTLASYWEGADVFKLYFYEKALLKKPNSVRYLVSILHFGLPPYSGSMNSLFDFEKYKSHLFKIDPQNSIFEEFEKYKIR